MVKRDITQLAVYEIGEDTETLLLKHLRSLYIEKTSEIIYVTKKKKLYGIVCMGEVLYGRKQNPVVKINRTFTYFTGFNLMKAHEIFQEKGSINKIPVVNDWGELIGDYSRWDDLLYIERNQKLLMQETVMRKVLAPYQAVYVAEPVELEHPEYIGLLEKLKGFHIDYTVLNKEQIGEKLSERAILICFDEDERRGIQCLHGFVPQERDYRGYNLFQYDISIDAQCKVRMVTYKGLLMQLMQEIRLDRLGIRKSDNLPYEGLDAKATVLLRMLEKRGVNCFCLYSYGDEKTEYGKKFFDRLQMRRRTISFDSEKSIWVEEKEKKEFYGELYQLEEYKNGTAQNEINEGVYNFGFQKDIAGKYFNVQKGRRKTCFQPQKYIGTIYLLGPCVVLGVFVEDRYTAASYLQKKLLEKGYPYRVVNCGEMLRRDADIDTRLAEIGYFSANDIVVVFSNLGVAANIQGRSLEEIFEENNVPCEWVIDGYAHCNHKVNQLIAINILKMIESSLSCKLSVDTIPVKKIAVNNAMRDYVEKSYIHHYFSDFNGWKYEAVGAVVMNCNPFSKGHRYLIEQAKQKVDVLIIFVVEEDASLFPFEERFELVQEGVKDLENVIVVPSGEFILSRNNFCEYFSKTESKTLARNADYDINIFAEYIAKMLHITHRFVGEEPEDSVTKVYNETMKRILPQKGIVYVEIPRIKSEKEIVSASRVRKYLKNAENDKAFSMLPETTIRYLKKQL